jgi:hypothetical protein
MITYFFLKTSHTGKIGSAVGHRLRKAALTGGKLGLRHAIAQGIVSPSIFCLRAVSP